MSNATEQLSLIAELGVGFTGFVAIFLIFARREGRFSPVDSIRVRVMIASSLIAVFMALLPLLLALTELSPTAIWRSSSLAFLAVVLSMGAMIARVQLALPPDDQAPGSPTNKIIGWGLATLAGSLLVANSLGAFGEPSALPYLGSLVLALGIATSKFVTVAIIRLL